MGKDGQIERVSGMPAEGQVSLPQLEDFGTPKPTARERGYTIYPSTRKGRRNVGKWEITGLVVLASSYVGHDP
jgi:hypothetical protein